ncbi:MAG: 3-oxoacyl-[acyl-carrier-protein] synthase II [Rhodothermales bacterium]|jgi:3-oxoacyl-[acyl-carrier-protein] synthase II
MGLVSDLGYGVESVYRRMLAGECGIRPITRFETHPFAQRNGGQISDELADELSDRFEDELAAVMVKQAIVEALGDARDADPQLGIILATNFGVLDMLEWAWRERIDTGDMDADTFAAHSDFLARIAEFAGATGPRAQLTLSCASGAAAVSLAREWLLAGRATRVLAIGYDLLTETCWSGLSNLRTITVDKMRPFDERRSGTIFSEGAAAVLLSSQPAPDDAIYVAGSATNNNAFHMTAPPKEAAGSLRAMTSALADANEPASAIDFVSAHATSTTANDRTESAAISTLLTDRSVPVGAFKSSLGHLLGAAGLAEVIIATQTLRHGKLPPVLHLEQQDSDCIVDAPREARAGNYSTCITNSAGIGGNNASVFLSKRSSSATRSDCEVRIVSAGWVLPGAIGSGARPPARASLAKNDALDGFSAKPYLHAVKGYLDPVGAYALAATALCLGEDAPRGDGIGIACGTVYGAPQSAYRFFEQLVNKGPRLASPLIFPHGYASTAPNLAAIEFGLAGPHMVLWCETAWQEALFFATNALQRGQANEMLLLVCEASDATVVPDSYDVLNGALCLRLRAGDTGAPLPDLQSIDGAHGAVHGALTQLSQG